MQTLRHGKALLVKLSPALQISGRCWHTCSYGHGTEWLGSSRISRTSTTTHTSRLVSQLQPCYCGPVRFASTEPSLDLEDGAPLAFQQVCAGNKRLRAQCSRSILRKVRVNRVHVQRVLSANQPTHNTPCSDHSIPSIHVHARTPP